MLGTILNWLSGGIVKQFTDPLLAAYQAKLNARNDSERLEAERQISFFEGQIALAREAAQSDRWYSPRSLMAYCATIVVAKLLIWDTVLGWGVTENPGSMVNGIVLTIIGFYFGAKAVTDLGGKLLAAAMAKR